MPWLFNFCEDQIFVDFVGFLSMKISVVLYTQCLRYNICSAWFLDIRIPTCLDWVNLVLIKCCGITIQGIIIS